MVSHAPVMSIPQHAVNQLQILPMEVLEPTPPLPQQLQVLYGRKHDGSYNIWIEREWSCLGIVELINNT